MGGTEIGHLFQQKPHELIHMDSKIWCANKRKYGCLYEEENYVSSQAVILIN